MSWLLICLLLSACKGVTVGKKRPGRKRGLAAKSAKGPSLPAPVATSADAPLERDPPAPPGDLRQDVEAFRSLRHCVRGHRLKDPLLASSLDTLGYANFAWDACRGLQALKEKRVALCEPILATRLRTACEADFAMYHGMVEHCPLVLGPAGVTYHDPTCQAVARRDVRPCAAFLKQSPKRNQCEGMVGRDLRRCGTDAICKRQILRWRSSLPKVISGQLFPSSATVRGIDKAKPQTSLSLNELARGGVALMIEKHRVRILWGRPAPVYGYGSQHWTGGILLEMEPSDFHISKRLTTARDRSRVVLQGEGGLLWQQSATKLVKFRFTKLSDRYGGAIAFEVSATLGPNGGERHTRWTVDTWVRDRVSIAPKKAH